MPGSGLGILSDVEKSTFANLTLLSDLAPDVRDRIEDGELLIYSKTQAYSTVHRRARMDFVAVRGRRTAGVRDWRTVVATEPPDRFFAFGRGLENDPEVFLQLGLPDELRQRPGPKRTFRFTFLWIDRGGQHLVAHDASTLRAERITASTESSSSGRSSPSTALTSPAE